MVNEQARPQRGAARVSLTLLVTLVAGILLSISSPASADVTTVSGSALGYISDVSLFGGPKQRDGVGQVACTGGQLGNPPDCTNSDLASASSPSVTLPSSGGDVSDSKDAGATAQYGPAKIFSGQYPNAANDPTGGATSPPSGPLVTSSSGTTGANGSVTSTAEVQPGTQGTVDPTQPRGIGPGPLVADAVSATCTASETDSVTGATNVSGSVHITNGVLVTSTDANGNAATTVPIPADPSPNDSGHTGTINNVGDSFTVTYNEQTTDANGVLTVWALHMRLLGPTAVGDLWIGGVTCGLTTVPGTSTQGTTATTQGSTSTTSGSTSTTQATTSTTQGGTSTTQASTSTTRASTSTTQAATSTTQATSTTSTPGSPPGRIVPTVVCDILAALSRLPIVGPLIAFVARLLGCGAG